MAIQSGKIRSWIFISLEFVWGIAFSYLAAFVYASGEATDKLIDSILKTFLVAFGAMILGVAIVGYIHFRMMRLTGYVNAFFRSVLGSIIGLVLCFIISLLVSEIPALLLLGLTVSGAVTGLNMNSSNKKISKPTHVTEQ